MNLPFGEEYQVRNAIDNPLVTHSLSDVWGIDEGVQVYGTLGAGPLQPRGAKRRPQDDARLRFGQGDRRPAELRSHDPQLSLERRLMLHRAI